MGFNKRFISKSTLIETYESGDGFEKLFNLDSIIFVDKKSHKFYEKFSVKGLTNKLKKKLKKWSQKKK